MNLTDRNEIMDLLKRNGFSFSKSLGQNFLINPIVCPEMAEAAIRTEDTNVIEIGPGIGVLTVELANLAKKVVSIELDERLFPVLNETLSDYDNVKVIQGDVLKLDLKQLIEDEFDGGPVVVCANLPYYITSPVIMKLLSEGLPLDSITVMVQKEAADRLCADVGTRAAGAVTVAINYYAYAEKLFFVDRDSFMPAPKVDSEVIQLYLKEDDRPKVDNEKAFFTMVKGAFTKRRKTILNSLSSSLGISKDELREILKSLNLPETARIENITLEELISIYNLSKKK